MRRNTLILLILFISTGLSSEAQRITINRNPSCVSDTLDIRWFSTPQPTSVSWDFGSGATLITTTVNGLGIQKISFTNPGTKEIIGTATFPGGSQKDTLRINVSQLLSSYIDTVYYFHPSATYILNASARVTNAISIAPYQYQWTMNGTTSSLDTANHRYTYRFTSPGNHLVRLRVRDAGGCIDSIDRIVRTDSMFSAPNVFTPNNDGINDTFIIRSTGLIPFSIEIYDRWGSVVYKPNLVGTQLIWDGHNSAGTLVKPGVYFYVVTPQDSSIEPIKGFVHVFHGEK